MDGKKFSNSNPIVGNSRAKLRKDYVRHQLFKNILNEIREQRVNNNTSMATERPKKSEYSERFHRPTDEEIGATDEEQNIIRHQLYGPPSDAITFWTSQNRNADFKQRHPLTKPNGEYFDGQWR